LLCCQLSDSFIQDFIVVPVGAPTLDHRKLYTIFTTVWLSVYSALISINEVSLRPARLVLGWVTGPEFNFRRRKPISAYNQPPRSTQPGYPSVGWRNEYQPNGGDAVRLGSKGRYGSCVGGR